MPLKITIADQQLVKFQEITMKLQYDSVADTVVIKADFDPANSADKTFFRPNSYYGIKVIWEKPKGGSFPLITGTVIGHGFSDLAAPTLNTIEAYSTTGILQDCQVCSESLQYDGLTIAEIARRIAGYFGINVIVDESVTDVANIVNAVTNIDIMQTAKDYLSEICRNYNIVLSHTATGELLLTSAKKVKVPASAGVNVVSGTNTITTDLAGVSYTSFRDNRYMKDAPVTFRFSAQNKSSHWIAMRLNTDSTRLHSNIYVLSQSQGQTVGNLQTIAVNPYVPERLAFFPPKIDRKPYRQRAVVNTVEVGPLKPLTARNVLADELKSISLDIDVQGWFLGGEDVGTFIRPNILISVQNPEVYLYKESTWFVESVVLNESNEKRTATMHCVLPQCFNNEEVTGNVFD